MGTSIYKHDLSVDKDYCGCENCTDILVKSRPDVIQGIHESFLAVGADCVETDSFGANKLVLAEFGIADQTFELAKAAADVARAACKKFSTPDKPRFVIGSIGPGTKLITLGNTDWDAMLDSYREQIRGLLAGQPGPWGKAGVDALVIETCQDILQVKCTINAALEALRERGLTTDDVLIGGLRHDRDDRHDACRHRASRPRPRACGQRILSLGLNCATGPTEMAEHVHWLGKHWLGGPPLRGGSSRIVSVMPNAGLPILVDGRTEYPLKPQTARRCSASTSMGRCASSALLARRRSTSQQLTKW